MKMKWYVAFVATIGMLALSGIGCAAEFVTIGTGGVGGTYYPLGGAMAEVLNKADIGVRATARTTDASVENCRLVATGKAQMGMTMGSVLWQAYKGTGPFEQDGPLPLAILFNMYPAPHHLVTVEGYGVESFYDIKGKRVSLGAPGGGDQALTRMILKTAGIDPENDMNAAQLSQPEAVMALIDGNVDAVFFNFAAPAAAVMEIAAVRKIKLIPFPEEVVTKLLQEYPFMMRYEFEPGIYPGVESPVLSIADANFMVVHKDLAEELSYKLVKTIIENRAAFMDITKQAANFVPEKAGKGIIPFHPGAAKYFEEQGVSMK